MRIVRFSVNNFRCIEGGLGQNSVTFNGSHTIFIFGQNNVGKSSFLKAYKAYYDNSVEADDFSFASEGEHQKNVEMELWLQIEGETDKQHIDTASNGKYDNLTSFLDNGILKVKRIWSGPKDTKNYTLNPSTGGWDEKSYGGIGLDGVFQSLLPKPLFIQAMPTEEQVKTVVNEILKEIANSKLTKEEIQELEEAQTKIKNLQDKVYDKNSINEYQRLVNESFSKLFESYKIEIDDGVSRLKYTHDKLGKDFEIDFKHTENDQSTNYAKMGHGAVRMAIFLLMLMRDKLQGQGLSQKTYLVLFEEPELFLHPKLTKKLRQLIYDVSAANMPFQVLCASHSPQMIDITKDHTSLVRMVKNISETHLYQILNSDLRNDEQATEEQVKQKVYEILRLNPFVCESFYADEVVLVEGDTEAIIWRGYLQEFDTPKDIFIVNCGTCNNIPFYQKIFSKFNIPYSVICDTDHLRKDGVTARTGWDGNIENPSFTSHIQKSIADQIAVDRSNGLTKKFFVCAPTFEPLHEALDEPFRYEKSGEGKPVSANVYWAKLVANKKNTEFANVPIIKYITSVLEG
ncbi:MAG TPA: AAA family ATPase [Patescibacteria group bacterium]|nr:AAA family ATPase [Patescibacteria group bacterium]